MITETAQGRVLAEALWYLSLLSKACAEDIQNSVVFKVSVGGFQIKS